MTASVIEFRMQNHTDFWQKMIRLREKNYIYIRAAAGFSNPGGLAVMWWVLSAPPGCNRVN